MRKLTWSAVAAMLVAASSPLLCHAQDKNVLEGAYIGLGGGATRARFVKDDFIAPGFDVFGDESDKGYKVTFGVNLNRYWALEVGRTNFGKFTLSYDDNAGSTVDQVFKVTGYWGSVLGMLPIGDHFRFFARLGQMKSDTTTASEKASNDTVVPALANAGVPTSGAKSRLSTILGVGAQIDFPGSLGLRIEAEDYGNVGDQEITGRARMRMATVSLMYRF